VSVLVQTDQVFHVQVKRILKLKIFQEKIRVISTSLLKNGSESINMRQIQKKEKKLWIN